MDDLQARSAMKAIGAIATSTAVAAAILVSWLAEKGRIAYLRTGVGALDFEDLQKTISADKHTNAKMGYIDLSAEDYEVLKKTDFLQDCGVKNYSTLQARGSDHVMLFYNTRYEKQMSRALEACMGAKGEKNLLSKEAFFTLAKNKETHVYRGITNTNKEVLKQLSKKQPVHYTVLKYKGETYAICLEEAGEGERFAKMLRQAKALEYLPNASQIKGDILYNTRRSERISDMVAKATPYSVIYEKGKFDNRVEFSKEDVSIYQDGKLTDRYLLGDRDNYPITDFVEKMKEPVEGDSRTLYRMSDSERNAYTNEHSENSIGEKKPVDINEKDLNQAETVYSKNIDQKMDDADCGKSSYVFNREWQIINGAEQIDISEETTLEL